MVTIEALDADHGDCLLLHYTIPFDGVEIPQLWLVDGGTLATWDRTLCPRLAQIADERAAGQTPPPPLLIRVGVVTHIDQDHIGGMRNMVSALTAPEIPAGTPAVLFGEFWFNGFRQIGEGGDNTGAALQARLAGADALLESVADGNTLLAGLAGMRDQDHNHLVLNRNFSNPDGKAIAPDAFEIAAVDVQILAPSQDRLDRLRQFWAADQKLSPAELAATDRRDDSKTNLSSIAFLASVQGKTILFTGDALAEDLITGWKALADAPASIDVMKVPHHGATGNNSVAFFKLVPARHYIFCANGHDGNPDLKTLQMLFEARPDGNYHIHITATRDTAKMAQQVAILDAAAKDRVTYRQPGDLSIRIDL